MTGERAYQSRAAVLGLSPTGLYAVRELGQAGIEVLGVTAQEQAGTWSRYLRLGCLIEPSEDRRLALLLAAFRDCEGKALLVPTSDEDIAFVIRNKTALAERFVFQNSYLDGIGESLMIKPSLYDLCRRCGVAIPRTWETTREKAKNLANDIQYPCLIKPSKIHAVKKAMAGRKVWVAKCASMYLNKVGDLPGGDTTWLVQELIPGPESQITLYAAYFDKLGRPQQAATCRKLRQFPPGFGSASLVRSAPEPETREISERLLTAIGYNGIAATEFKRDPRDGILKMIEINPRPSLWFSVTTAANKQITLAAYHDLCSLSPLEERHQIEDVEWRYGAKDMYSRIFYVLARDFPLPPPELQNLRKPASRVSAVFDARDVYPMAGEVFNWGRKFLRRTFKADNAKVG